MLKYFANLFISFIEDLVLSLQIMKVIKHTRFSSFLVWGVFMFGSTDLSKTDDFFIRTLLSCNELNKSKFWNLCLCSLRY